MLPRRRRLNASGPCNAMRVLIDTAMIATATAPTGTVKRAVTDPAIRVATVRAMTRGRGGLMEHRRPSGRPDLIKHLAPKQRFARSKVARNRVALSRLALNRARVPGLTRAAQTRGQALTPEAGQNRGRGKTRRRVARVNVAAAAAGGAVVAADAMAAARVALTRGQTVAGARVAARPPLHQDRPVRDRLAKRRHATARLRLRLLLLLRLLPLRLPRRPNLRLSELPPSAQVPTTSMWCGLPPRATFSVRGPKKGSAAVSQVRVTAPAAQRRRR
jgi:hypothetical protein